MTSRSHEPLLKDENKIVANLDIKQAIPDDIIDNIFGTGLSVKQEEIDVKVEEDYLKDESLVTCAALTSTIDNMADNGSNVKLEAVDIKDGLLVTPAASGSASAEYGGKHNSWKDFENMMMATKVFYSCSICAYKTTRYSLLLIHNSRHTGMHRKRAHTGEKPYSCCICEYKAAQKSHLVLHMRTHTGEKPYSCYLCEYKAARKDVLILHTKTHTGEKPYSCSVCEYKATEKNYVTKHMMTHTGEKPHSCSFCEYKTTRRSRLVNHMKKHNREEKA